MLKFLLLISLLLISGFGINSVQQPINKFVPEPTPVIESTPNSVEIEHLFIGNTIGLITLSDNYEKGDFVKIYNEDGTLWHKLTHYYDDSDGKFEYANDNFLPFAFHPDYFILAFRCVGKKADRYEVIVNEETNLKKYIKANDKVLKFETWEQHILGLFAVDFDEKENPLLDAPEGRTKNFVKSDITFRPVEIKGEWLKIKLEPNVEKQTEETQQESGWIKWKKDGKLLIELSRLC